MSLIDILNTLVLSLIMFSIGASLTRKDFKNVYKSPQAPLLGLFLQMVFLPALAYGLLLFSNLNPYLKTGIFIVTLCPGGTTSNFISYLVNADTALSVSLTTINSLMIMITIPVLANLGVAYYLGTEVGISIPFGQTLLQVFLIILLPVIIGVLFNEKQPDWSAKIQEPLKYLNIILLGLVFGIRAFANENSGGSGITIDDMINILPMALAIHLGSMFLSFWITRVLKFSATKAVTIGIEVGLQNTALALLVAGTMLANPEITKPAIVFGVFTFFTTLGFGWGGMRLVKRK